MHNAPNVPVLMLHHVTPQGGMIAVTPNTFEQQIASLARAGYTALTCAQFADFMHGGHVPEKSVLITFDDGYLDNWVYAHPVLQRYGMHAVLFLVTGWLGEGPARPHAGQGLALPDVYEHRAAEQLGHQGRYDDFMLRWSEVQAMLQAGTFEVHSHTHTHVRWDEKYAGNVQAKRESLAQDLTDSRATLISRLGEVSEHLCWPFGIFDADYEQAARDAGFRYLYTTDAMGQNLPGGNPEHIYRFAVHDTGGTWLRRRLWLTRHPILGPRYHAWRAWKRKVRQRMSSSRS